MPLVSRHDRDVVLSNSLSFNQINAPLCDGPFTLVSQEPVLLTRKTFPVTASAKIDNEVVLAALFGLSAVVIAPYRGAESPFLSARRLSDTLGSKNTETWGDPRRNNCAQTPIG
jgi:hypothetical protein